jgi:hypothetical protein
MSVWRVLPRSEHTSNKKDVLTVVRCTSYGPVFCRIAVRHRLQRLNRHGRSRQAQSDHPGSAADDICRSPSRAGDEHLKAAVTNWRHLRFVRIMRFTQVPSNEVPHENHLFQHHFRSRRWPGAILCSLYGLRADHGATIAFATHADCHDRLLFVGALPSGLQQPPRLKVELCSGGVMQAHLLGHVPLTGSHYAEWLSPPQSVSIQRCASRLS